MNGVWFRTYVGLALCACGVLPGAYAEEPENPATRIELPTVEVIGTTPLAGVGTPIKDVPANVQAATGRSIARQKPATVGDFLSQNLASVSTSSAPANAFQPDVSFRGFTASPLLGTPQGLSVFQDGVRINEPFGDTVNWDLIPEGAISSINLIPGSNPVFGLNTLGGALAINTKSGFQYPGISADAYGGSFGRRVLELQGGGSRGRQDYFASGKVLSEDGWRDHSGSRINQLFAKTGYQTESTDVDVSFTGAHNVLHGTQALPLSMLDNPKQAYTYPDETDNDLAFVSGKASHFVGDTLLLAGNVYYRRLDQGSFDSNVNDNFDPGLPADSTNSQGINDKSRTLENGYGASFQLTNLKDWLGRTNQLTLGVSADLGHTEFTQFEQPANFTADRNDVGIGPFALRTRVNADNRYYGLFATDTLSLAQRWTLTLSGRYNRAAVDLNDQQGTALSGQHRFQRFNPAIGLNYNPSPAMTAYATYNEGMRAPTPVELTCASPNAPCRLPNSFLADPPLDPVIAKSWEAGARGRWRGGAQWSVAVFRTNLDNDIQFVSSATSALNAGYFTNVPRSRRQGLELGLSRAFGRLGLSAQYSYIDATYESTFAMPSPANSGADASGNILVTPGNRIPGIPRNLYKLRAQFAGERFGLGVNIVGASGQYARGDDNNADINGLVPGYTVVNLDASYRLTARWQVFAVVNNLFDRTYQTLGVLGENVFTGPGNSFDPANAADEQFRTPAAPRGIWVGIRYRLGKTAAGTPDLD